MNKLVGTLVFKDWWGATSAIIDESCLYFKVKALFIHNAAKKGLLEKRDYDRRNKMPHIQLTDNSKPKDPDAFKKMNNTPFEISVDSFKFHGDHI
jgi:2'-5' RNA ligase